MGQVPDLLTTYNQPDNSEENTDPECCSEFSLIQILLQEQQPFQDTKLILAKAFPSFPIQPMAVCNQLTATSAQCLVMVFFFFGNISSLRIYL